jgi:hypothetical protein
MSLGMAKVASFVPVISDDLEIRRAAIAVCATLPRDLNDALAVLELARLLVVDFLGAKPPQ